MMMGSMKCADSKTVGLTVILVAYHLREADKAFRLIDDFCQRMQMVCARAVVVDNGGVMKVCADNDESRQVISGDNSAWEFSGWLRGIGAVSVTNVPVVALLNDSYERNWSISPISLVYLRRMYEAARNGRVAVWLDNFSYLRRPRFSRRPNSRIVFVPSEALQSLSLSLKEAIKTLRMLVEERKAIFSTDEQACLDRWATSQSDRWAPQTMPYKMQRIFLEHHMFDRLAPGLLQYFPRAWFESLIYGIGRRVFRERR